MVDSITASTSTGVSRAIIRRVPTVGPKAAVTEAITLLKHRTPKGIQCSCVLAVENGHVQGILTQADALDLMTQEISLVGLELQAVMTAPVVTLRESEFINLRVAVSLLQQHQIQHLPVLDAQDHLVGLVTHESLMQALYPKFLSATQQQEPTQSLEPPSGETTLTPSAATDLQPLSAVPSSSVQIKDQSDRERLVAQIAMQIRASLSLQTILDTTVEQIRRVLRCDRVNVWKFESGWERVVVAESTDSDLSLVGERVNDSSFSQAQVDQYQQGAMRIIVDAHAAEMTDCHRDLLNRLQTRAKIMVPLLCNGTLWGFLNVTESQYPRHWQPEETELLEALSVHLSIALHQAITHEHLQAELTARQQAEAGLEVKHKLLAKIAKDEPLSEILDSLIESIEQQLLGAHCSVLLLDDDNRMRYAAAPNLPLGYLQVSNGVEAGEGVGSCGTAINRRATVIVADIASDRLWEVYKDFALQYGLRACWSIPIVASNDQVLGTFAVYFREPKEPQLQELELIESMVDLAGIAIERHRFEDALLRSEARWQFALEGAGDGIWDWNLQDNTVFFSRQWKAMLGLAEDDEVNSRAAWENRIHPDDHFQCNARIQSYLQGETATYQNEHQIQCKDGSYKWVLDRGTVMEWTADGAPLRMIGIYTDISDRKAAETVLRKREATLQETQEICHLGSWEMELPSQTVTWSQELFRMFQCDPNQPTPPFAEILQKLHPEDRPHLEECITEAIFKGKPYQLDYRCILPDGTVRYHEARGRIEHDSQGRVIRLFGSALDITERKRAEMALQNLVEGTAATTGEDFFPALVRHIAAALAVDYAIVGEVVGEDLHILASWANGSLQCGGFVKLAHTPCQQTYQDGLFYCQEAVKVHCPECLLLEGMDVQSYLGIALRDTQGQPIGSLCILDKNPLEDFSKTESLLRVFGARAAAELERKRADQALEQLNQALERKVEERTAALRASERRYATLAAFAPVAIFRFELPFHCSYVSDRWSEMTGRPVATALGQGWLEAIHPEDRDRFLTSVVSGEDNTPLENLSTSAFEGRHLLPDGTIRWFYAQVTTETDEQGEVIGCIGTLTDITERKRIEAELIESEAKYRCLVEDSTDLIWMTNGEGLFTYLSPQFQTLFGWQPQEWIGKRASELAHPEDAQAVIATFTQGGKHTSKIEFRHRHQNGSYIWVQGSATTIYNADGETLGLQGIISDIHDRKCAELALQDNEAQLRRLAANIPGMMYRYVLHADGRDEFTYVSSGIRELYGLEPDAIQQSSHALWETIYTEDIPKLQVEIAKSAENLTPFLVEHRVATPNGSFKWIQLMSRPERQANGDILWDGVALDLTHQKQTEQQLRDSEAFLDGILNAITDYIFVKDEQHRWVRFNQAFCDLVGAPKEQLINRSDYDFFSPEEAEVFWEKDNQVLASGQENLNEEWITHPTHGTRLVATKKTCFQDSTGRKLLVGYSRDITEHKQAERQIQEQEQFLRSIYEGVTQPIFVIDVLPDGRLQQGGLNPAAAKRKQELAMARKHQPSAEILMDTVAPYETEAAIIANCRHCIKTQQPLTLEECLSLPDQTLWTLSTYTPLVNASGQVYRIVCTVYDITDRKQAEIQVQESQRFLQTVIDTFPLSVFWKDHHSVYLGCNQNFLLDTGFQSISDVIGKTDYDMPWGNTEGDAYRADDQQVMLQNQPKLGIIESQGQQDGQQVWLETNKLPLHNFEGQVIGVLGTYQNITHRIQADAELAKSRQQYYSLIQSVKGIVWEYNLHTDQFTFVSDKAEAILGYPLSDWLTEPHFWQNHVYVADRTDAIYQWEAALEQQTTCEMEYRMVAADGRLVWIYDISSVLYNDAGLPIASNGILLDVSDRKQVEIQLQQQSRQKLLLWHITQTIRQSLDLEQTLDATVKEVKQLLGANRAVVYRFTPPQGGIFVAEDVDPDWISLLHPPLYKIWENAYFQESQSGRFQNYETIVVDDIYIANLQPWHINLLEQLQAQAYAITPIFVGETLWGLVGIYQNDAPRQWTTWETELLQQIAIQLAIAIQQGSLYDQVQSELLERQQAEREIALQLRRQQALGAITQSIRELLDINSILATATHQVKEVLQADRVIVFRLFPEGRIQVVEESVAEPFPALKHQFWDNETWPQSILSSYWQGNPRIACDVSEDNWADWIIEHTAEGQIRSRIAAPILQEVMDGGENCWVSPSGRNALWGLLVVHACQDTRIWLESEAQLLQQIANQLAIAMQQAHLFEQLQQELAERQQAQQQLTQFNQQLVQSNEELARATQMKDEFLANMSHELRTPLNAILGMTEGLQEAIFGPINERQSHALATIERSSSHLLGLINDILDLAKIEAGQVELEYKPTVVSLLCKSSLSFVNQQALSKRIQIETLLPPHLPDLWGDERRLRQVLINLLNNAVKFTSEGGRITLAVKVHPLSKPVLAGPPPQFDSMLHICVIDTGIGIAPENLPKLFKPFSQIDSALNRQYNGTGLGLSLVKRIVELHGGSVEVVSEVGIGSCFTVLLPYRIPPTVSPVSEGNLDTLNEVAQDFTNVQRPLILLAEDNEANISTVSSYLGAKGYRIVLARNGEEVIAQLATEQPALILMDIQMPGMDGLEAIHQIRGTLGLTQIPIIALTTLAMNNDEDRCLAAGANAYLTKPVKLKQLVTTIQTLLGS